MKVWLASLSPAHRRGLSLALGPLLVLFVQQVLFPVPLGVVVDGIVIGMLTAMITVGLVLVYRANRVLNFAQGDLGYVPAVLATMLILASGLNYFLAFFLGLAAAIAVGGAVEFLVIRRFFRSSRLILTVATVGLSQVLSFLGILLPRWWDERVTAQRIDGPLDMRWDVGPRTFTGDHVIALVVAPLAILAVGALIRYTSLGIAIRASAERADRAGLLGIPVKRLQTIVWALSASLSYLGIFLTSSIIGLPIGGALGFGVALRSFAALMLARLTNIPTAVAASIAVSVLQQAVNWNLDSPSAGLAALALAIIATLLVLRPGVSRAERDDTATWQSSDDARSIPPELASLPEVRAVRWGFIAVCAAVALWLPHWLGTADSLKASATLVFVLVVLSLVVLTGWAGQISLGQTGFMAVGAVVGARLTNEWGFDLALALPIAGLVGMAVAVLIGIPALRMPGLYLSVTTMAFAAAVSSYLLNPLFRNDAPGWLKPFTFDWIPTESRVERLPLLGRVRWDSPTQLYYVVLASVVVIFIGVHGIRHSRTGRVLIALRENEQASQSYGVSATRAKLTAFGISGFIAAYAGALWVHHQQAFVIEGYAPGLSLGIFTASVVGGVGAILGGFLGGLYWTGGFLFLTGPARLMATGAGVLIILLSLPAGLAGGLQQLRDYGLRKVADRRGIIVPSLVADRMVDDPAEVSDGGLSRGHPATKGPEAESVGADSTGGDNAEADSAETPPLDSESRGTDNAEAPRSDMDRVETSVIGVSDA